MTERPTIAFRVEESQKDKWTEYADENDEYDSLSHLIRVAVVHEMSDSYGPLGRGSGSGIDAAGGEQLGGVVTSVDQLESRVEEMQERLADATRAMNAGGGVSEETLSAVYNALPKGADGSPTTAEGIAAGIDPDPETVRVALEQLYETTSAVQKQEIQQVEEGDGITTLTTNTGQEIEVEDTGTAFRRRNPLWYKK